MGPSRRRPFFGQTWASSLNTAMEPRRRSTNRPDKDRFARLVLAGIRQAGEKRENVYDRSQFRLVLAAGAGNTMFLNNSYGEYCNASEAERDNTLARIVPNWFVYGKSAPEEFEDASHDLLPVVRARSYYTDAELMLKAEGQKAANVPYHQLGDDFAVALVYDPPHSNRHCRPIGHYATLDKAKAACEKHRQEPEANGAARFTETGDPRPQKF